MVSNKRCQLDINHHWNRDGFDSAHFQKLLTLSITGQKDD
jgi:hypothetical protein